MVNYTSPRAILESVLPRQSDVENAMAAGDSGIQRFYNDSTILLSGATGFLGKTLLEKLFRSTNIKKIFVLIRPKKGNNVRDRLDEILKDPLYATLRKKKPDFTSRIICVEGDIGETRLGISEQDWRTIIEEVDLIFHMAATTKFDEALRLATFINVRGTREMLHLGRACKNLRSFVHASTAFAHATTNRVNTLVQEQFYPCPVPPEAMIWMAESMEDDRFYSAAEKLMVDWPNTYTFTKALGEEVVRKMAGDLPICIIRPPYVMSTYYDPVPGWLDSSCVYGPSGMLIAIGIGVMHVSLNTPDVRMSYCPVDFVSNATIAACVACGQAQGSRGGDVDIYSLVDSNTCVRWDFQGRILRSPETLKLSTPKTVWSGFLFETNNTFVYWLLTWLFHYIPAYILDSLYGLVRLKKPENIKSFVKLYSKLYQTGHKFRHFLTNNWYFDNSNLRRLYNDMSEKDKKIYNYDLNCIDWTQLLYIWLIGLRKYIIKDGLTANGSGYKKQMWLTVANYVIFVVYIVVVWQIFSLMFKLIYFYLN